MSGEAAYFSSTPWHPVDCRCGECLPGYQAGVAAERERIAVLAEQHKATYHTFCADADCQRWHGTTATSRAPFDELIRLAAPVKGGETQ